MATIVGIILSVILVVAGILLSIERKVPIDKPRQGNQSSGENQFKFIIPGFSLGFQTRTPGIAIIIIGVGLLLYIISRADRDAQKTGYNSEELTKKSDSLLLPLPENKKPQKPIDSSISILILDSDSRERKDYVQKIRNAVNPKIPSGINPNVRPIGTPMINEYVKNFPADIIIIHLHAYGRNVQSTNDLIELLDTYHNAKNETRFIVYSQSFPERNERDWWIRTDNSSVQLLKSLRLAKDTAGLKQQISTIYLPWGELSSAYRIRLNSMVNEKIDSLLSYRLYVNKQGL